MTCGSYSPDIMAMGDCAHCGHTYQSHMEPTMTRPFSPEMDAQIGREHKVLDHGMIRVVDYMGNDAAVVQAARVSYGEGTKTPSDDRSLIRYLLSHRHTTPFEMCEIKLHVKLPIFVARQWIRHRTASVNEYSARYSILDNEFYIPEVEDIKPQSQTNKQGRDGTLSDNVSHNMRNTIDQHSQQAYQIYEELHTGWPWFAEDGTAWDEFDEAHMQHEGNYGMAREMARMVVPPNIYTQWYWKVNLHNLLHFLSLRANPHAQMEIRVYADVICDLVKAWCPQTFEAFEDYSMNSVRFSAMEMETLRGLLEDRVELGVKQCSGMSLREHREFERKLGVPDEAYDG